MVSTTVALAITVVTLAVFTGLGIWYTRGRVSSVEDFITARDSAGPATVTASLIASGMGAWILFSPAEAGAAFGGLPAILGYALGSAAPMVAFVWLGPRIRRLIPEGHTLTEYARARYGRGMHAYVLLVSVFYMFIFLAAEMTGIAGALSLVAGVPTWATAGLVGVFVLAYTGYGGLVASLFTDTVQTLVLLPLIAVGFGGAVVALGGADAIHAAALSNAPDTLDPGFVPGLKFGAFVIVAILGAEMLNQAWWQRIYAAEDERSLRRGFAVTAIAVVPMILLAGLFGIAAQGLGLVDGAADASISFFLVLQQAFPEWVTLVVVLVAVLLVMSTADTLFNAISSLVTADLPQVSDRVRGADLTSWARGATVVVALGAVAIGAQGYSVLTLFLTADLLAAATFVPLLHGLYSERASQRGVLVASVAGLATGLAFFPSLAGTLRPVYEASVGALLGLIPGLGLPGPSFLYAFAGALGVSGGVSLLATRFSRVRYPLERLSSTISRLGASRAPAEEREGDR